MDARSLFLIGLVGFIVVVGLAAFFLRSRMQAGRSVAPGDAVEKRAIQPAQPSPVLPPSPLPPPHLSSLPSPGGTVEDGLAQPDRQREATDDQFDDSEHNLTPEPETTPDPGGPTADLAAPASSTRDGDQIDEALAEGSAGPEEPKSALPELEPARFSAYYPKEAAPAVWLPLRAYIFRLSAAAAVAADAADALGAKLADYRPVAGDATTPLTEGVLVTATPEMPDFQFNPPSASIHFYETWHALEFKLRASSAPAEQAANGRITFTVEGVIVADLPLSIFVTAVPNSAVSMPASTAADPYDAVFCSYSHKDTAIVERLERAYRALGFDYLRDVKTLRSGEEWNTRLLKLIDEADIFQLFWSTSAAASLYVQQEWEYALSLGRGGAFIRPVYWEQPMPKTPQALGKLNFHYDAALGEEPD